MLEEIQRLSRELVRQYNQPYHAEDEPTEIANQLAEHVRRFVNNCLEKHHPEEAEIIARQDEILRAVRLTVERNAGPVEEEILTYAADNLNAACFRNVRY